ncbi:MAG: hypothetical protein REJ50_25215, partial [Bordetella sp.]|nr:hypothetical protein [Bordetella sp.]
MAGPFTNEGPARPARSALRQIDRFGPHLPASAPPPLPAAPSGSSARRADEIDYKIEGEDLQFVEVELDPGESAVAEAGALMY